MRLHNYLGWGALVYVFFGDDIVLVDETKEMANDKLEIYRQELEEGDLS